MKGRRSQLLWLLILPGLWFSNTAMAATSIVDMLQNLATTIPHMQNLVEAFCFLMGFMLVLKGIYAMRLYGEMRTMMASHISIVGPLSNFFVAGCFLYLPTALETGLYTLFRSSSPIAYNIGGGSAADIMKGAISVIMKFIGLIAFVRGMLLLTRAANQGAQPGTVSKAVTHIVAGLLAINIVGFWTILKNTLGF